MATRNAHSSSIHARLLALASLSVGFSMISSVFGFYYVKCFLNYYHIQESWFQIAQTLYLVWNTVNDPLFAYLQDSSSLTFTRTRRESVLYASPLFALSFLVPWFPWGNPETMQSWVTGLHLITALCFWDTMFTYVGLASCCLFTEISLDYSDRIKALRYGQIGSLIGSLSVFFVQYMSSGLEHFQAFQTTCVFISVISCLLMRYCGKHAHTERELKGGDINGQSIEKVQLPPYLTLTKQLLTNRDLLSFVLTNFFQEFHRTFLNNFLAIFCDQLIGKGAIPELVRSAFYGGSFLVSKVTNIMHEANMLRCGFTALAIL